jgi:hypothetical protein
VDGEALKGRIQSVLHRVGLEAQKTPPFVGRRYRYRANDGVAKALGPKLMVPETWRATPEPDYPTGDLAKIFLETPGLHKWLHYIPAYESALAGLRDQPLRFLEIGVDRGGSLDAWSRYFGPEATIVGIDINPWCARFDDPPNNRYVRIGGQQDPEFLRSVIHELGPFDVILDDGSHRPSHMNASFRHLFDAGLAPNGLYLVEDLQTNYWLAFRDTKVSFVDLAKGLVDEMHAQYPGVSSETAFRVGAPDRRASFEVPRVTKLLKSIEFFDSIVVIRKADGERELPASVYTGDPPAFPDLVD